MNRTLIRTFGILFSLTFLGTVMPVCAADWPQWLGPNRDNIAPTTGFVMDLKQWQVLWRTNVGPGRAAVTVAAGRAYVEGQDGKSQESLNCFDAVTGARLWKFSSETHGTLPVQPGGPNAVPAVFEGKVFTVSKEGQAVCLSADTGEKIWQADLPALMGVKMPSGGVLMTPVVYKDKVFFSQGKVAALDRATGKKVWVSATAYLPGYGAPMPFPRDDKEYVAVVDGQGLSVLALGDGREIVRRTFKNTDNLAASTPMVSPNGRRIAMFGGLNSALYSFDGKSLMENWTTTELKSGLSACVRVTGVFFGIDGSPVGESNNIVCFNWDDGVMRWTGTNVDYRTMIGVGTNVLLTVTAKGDLATVWAARKNYNEISRITVLDPECMSPPVYAEDRIYVRNEKGDVVCLGKK